MRGFAHPSAAPRLAREGVGQLTPDWWMHGVGRKKGRNPSLDEASRKVEPKTGWSEGRSPALSRADRTRGSPLFLVHARPCLTVVHGLFFLYSDLPVVHNSLALSPCGPFFALGSCARGPVSGLLVGDADGRRSSAGCVVDLRVRARRVPERDATTTKGGQVTCTVLWASSVSHGHIGLRTPSTPLPVRGSSFCFV